MEDIRGLINAAVTIIIIVSMIGAPLLHWIQRKRKEQEERDAWRDRTARPPVAEDEEFADAFGGEVATAPEPEPPPVVWRPPPPEPEPAPAVPPAPPIVVAPPQRVSSPDRLRPSIDKLVLSNRRLSAGARLVLASEILGPPKVLARRRR